MNGQLPLRILQQEPQVMSAQAAVLSLVNHRQAPVRRAASPIVDRAYEGHPVQWMHELVRMVDHSSQSVRCAALEILALVEGDDALIALLKAAAVRWTRGRDLRTLHAARTALGCHLERLYGQWEVFAGVRVVLRLGAHPEPRVRLALAVHFAGTLRTDLEAARMALVLLDDPDEEFRDAVVAVIAKEKICLFVKEILRAESTVSGAEAVRVVAGAVRFLEAWERARATRAGLADEDPARRPRPRPLTRSVSGDARESRPDP